MSQLGDLHSILSHLEAETQLDSEEAHGTTESTGSDSLQQLEEAHGTTESTGSDSLQQLEEAHGTTESTGSGSLQQLEEAHGTTESTGSDSLQQRSSDADVPREDEDPELQKALEEMQRLDKILHAIILKMKEVECKGKELKEILWQELQNTPRRSSESAEEAENTRHFLALTASNAQEPKEEGDFVPVFGTQVPEQEYERNYGDKEQSEKELDSAIGLSAAVAWETGQERLEDGHGGAARAKEKQEDFVRKNIELAGSAGMPVPLTRAEEERLAELLEDLEEDDEDEDEDDASGADSEGDLWAASVSAGPRGYTPDPAQLARLTAIDFRLRRLLPLGDFLSVRSSFLDLSISQVHGSEASWELSGDAQPGEKVLQDIRERREQDRRLQEIEQQLEILGRGQEMTSESPGLSEEQLSSLLDHCEVTRTWSQEWEPGDTTPTDPDGDRDSPLSCTSCLSEALLSQLLENVYTTSFSRLENGELELMERRPSTEGAEGAEGAIQ